eukprot:COSAG06_NODE_9836_length_1807_cov_1.361241_2_plen_29_part_01
MVRGKSSGCSEGVCWRLCSGGVVMKRGSS